MRRLGRAVPFLGCARRQANRLRRRAEHHVRGKDRWNSVRAAVGPNIAVIQGEHTVEQNAHHQCGNPGEGYGDRGRSQETHERFWDRLRRRIQWSRSFYGLGAHQVSRQPCTSDRTPPTLDAQVDEDQPFEYDSESIAAATKSGRTRQIQVPGSSWSASFIERTRTVQALEHEGVMGSVTALPTGGRRQFHIETHPQRKCVVPQPQMNDADACELALRQVFIHHVAGELGVSITAKLVPTGRSPILVNS